MAWLETEYSISTYVFKLVVETIGETSRPPGTVTHCHPPSDHYTGGKSQTQGQRFALHHQQQGSDKPKDQVHIEEGEGCDGQGGHPGSRQGPTCKQMKTNSREPHVDKPVPNPSEPQTTPLPPRREEIMDRESSANQHQVSGTQTNEWASCARRTNDGSDRSSLTHRVQTPEICNPADTNALFAVAPEQGGQGHGGVCQNCHPIFRNAELDTDDEDYTVVALSAAGESHRPTGTHTLVQGAGQHVRRTGYPFEKGLREV